VRNVATKPVRRCAVYTRKSSEEGLEQDFNSLHAQRESCEAYVNSQKHEGWIVKPTMYEDGGYSAGSMDRPALELLLADIKSGSIDIVVVYKVDRLTRSLSDFVKIVEIFDTADVSFVSITQQFNTSTSMGRLTLNVLLSFAQFEREVTGERIRDKIAASKKKGMWMGGWVPIGFDRKDRTLTINEPEARTVRTIFDLFIKLKNVRDVQAELVRLNLKTKRYAIKRGRAVGNLSFARGHIYKILSNPLYQGEIRHKGVNHPGQHPRLIDQATWDAVQSQLAANKHANRSRSNAKSTSLLAGLLFSASGNRLVSTHATKNGKRYHYYITSDGAGRTAPAPETTKFRLSAAQLDTLVLTTLCKFLTNKQELANCLRKRGSRGVEIATDLEAAGMIAQSLASDTPDQKRAVLHDLVSRVTIARTHIEISIRSSKFGTALSKKLGQPSASERESDILLTAPFVSPSSDQTTKLVIEERSGALSSPDPVVVKAVARAQGWFEELTTGRARSMAEIAARENITDNYISNLIHLAWLPPLQVSAILEGDAAATQLAKDSMRTRSSELLWTRLPIMKHEHPSRRL
jgi:site-specific DNA recombinase